MPKKPASCMPRDLSEDILRRLRFTFTCSLVTRDRSRETRDERRVTSASHLAREGFDPRKQSANNTARRGSFPRSRSITRREPGKERRLLQLRRYAIRAIARRTPPTFRTDHRSATITSGFDSACSSIGGYVTHSRAKMPFRKNARTLRCRFRVAERKLRPGRTKRRRFRDDVRGSHARPENRENELYSSYVSCSSGLHLATNPVRRVGAAVARPASVKPQKPAERNDQRGNPRRIRRQSSNAILVSSQPCNSSR